MEKILVTGGSGFIGTNLISHLLNNSDCSVLNIDIMPPKIKEHNSIWQDVDIRDLSSMDKTIKKFQPNLVIHLAARTDLDGKTIEDYNPHTVYGESKVLTEKIIKEENPTKYSWSIIRPTSIWGPWFGEPYANFFKIVMSRKYFHMGANACTKTYGYIDNTVYQILSLLNTSSDKMNKKVFYLGDYPVYKISEWADEIADYLGIRILNIPFFIFRIVAIGGDILKKFGIEFPMTSFRLKNMTTNNILDISPIREIAPTPPVERKEGTKVTIDWIRESKRP